MCAALTLPSDLTDAERSTVEAFRQRTDADAALAIRVRREHRRLMERQGLSYEGALDTMDASGRFPRSRDTLRNIVRRRRGWEV